MNVDIRLERSEFLHDNSTAYKIFRSPEFAAIATLIDLEHDFCESGKCRITDNGNPIYFDNQHLNSIGSNGLAETIKKYLEIQRSY